MSSKSPFFIVFWALAVVMTVAAGALLWGAGYGLLGMDVSPAALAPLLLLVVAYICIVAPVVYRDASRRCLDPWLWAAVATFLPYLLGVVLYLVRRTDGAQTDTPCPGCGQPVAGDWRVCPRCRHDLAGS